MKKLFYVRKDIFLKYELKLKVESATKSSRETYKLSSIQI